MNLHAPDPARPKGWFAGPWDSDLAVAVGYANTAGDVCARPAPAPRVRAVAGVDRPWVEQLLREHWGSTAIASRGRLHRADDLPGVVAEADGARLGLATYAIGGDGCQIVTLNALRRRVGLGTALVGAVREAAVAAGCRRLWAITTNDNLDALAFYQKAGFRLAAIHRDAVAAARRLKPGIPAVGHHGLPILDEVEVGSPL